MKPLGIVLLFINLLAAAGVAYVATQSWSERHEQNTALLKHELVISGLPLESAPGAKAIDPAKPEDVIPFNATPALGRTLTEVRAKVLLDLFAGAKREGWLSKMSAAPPLSVVAEVTAAQEEIRAQMAGFEDKPAEGLAFLVGTVDAQSRLSPGVLTLLADDFEERVTYREWLTEAQKPQPTYPVKDLWNLAKTALDAKFARAVDKPNVSGAEAVHRAKLDAKAARDAALDAWLKAPLDQVAARKQEYEQAQSAYWQRLVAKSPPLSDGDRRRTAAGLLAVIDPSAGGQKRTALVVGVADYTAALLERTERLTAMPARYSRQSEAEVAKFVVVYEQKLATSRDLDRLLQRQIDLTKAFAAQKQEAVGQVESRTAFRDAAKGRTDDLKTRVDALAAVQSGVEGDLFARQKLVGDLFAELFELEEKVFQAEQQKLGK